MRTNVLRPIHIGLALLIALPALAADFSIEPAGSPPADGVPEAVTAMLHGEGVRVKDPDGKVVAEFWGRKSAFEGDPVSGFGIRFTTIPEGALVGLAQFPDKGSDYREQHIPAGIYTLRYGLHPEDGDHMGAAPSRDFVLLTPASADTEASKNYGFDDLVELSYKVREFAPDHCPGRDGRGRRQPEYLAERPGALGGRREGGGRADRHRRLWSRGRVEPSLHGKPLFCCSAPAELTKPPAPTILRSYHLLEPLLCGPRPE